MNRREFVLGSAGLLAVRQSLHASKSPFPIMTGLPTLDEATGGFGPGEVVQVAGNAASGRSALALQIASHASESSSVAYFAPNVRSIGDIRIDTKTRCAHRILGPMAGVGLQRLAWDYLTKDERERTQHAEKAFAKKRLVIFGSLEVDDWRLESVGAMARRLCRENQLKLLVIDDLMELHPRQPWTATRSKIELNTMGSFFKNLADELRITVLACSGLSLQTNQRPDCRPQSIDLAGFGLPQEFCSTIALTYRPSFVRPDIEGLDRKAEITLTKAKSGRTGTLAMAWNPKNAQFAERDSGPA